MQKIRRYYVYILLCNDDSLYTGVTNNLRERIEAHNLGTAGSGYTISRRPVVLQYAAEFADVNDAIRAEKQLKGWTRKKKWALIRGDIDGLKAFAACQNESHYSNQ